jgi:hypothetical protein
VDQDEIFRCYNSCKIFLDQTNNFIWHLLYPNAPQTQSEINFQAMDDFEKSENDLSELILTIKKAKTDNLDFDINVILFDKTIEQWKNYRKSKAELDSSFVEGGSMYTLLYNSSLTETTKEKIESLKNEFEIDLKKYSLIQKNLQ